MKLRNILDTILITGSVTLASLTLVDNLSGQSDYEKGFEDGYRIRTEEFKEMKQEYRQLIEESIKPRNKNLKRHPFYNFLESC